MVKRFKRQHTSNMVGSEMYDNGFPDSHSDEEEEKVDYDKHFNLEEGEYPNLDSPRMTNDIKIDRTFKVNRKVDNDQEEE